MPPDIFSGVDHICFDRRHFNPLSKDIEQICSFFSIGKLKHFENEKNVIISHSNFFIFVATACGEYAFKFYPPRWERTITSEYAINRFLLLHDFATPVMHAGDQNKPFCRLNNFLVACFTYIPGQQAWECIKKHDVIRKINIATLTLKKILLTAPPNFPFTKQTGVVLRIKELTQKSCETAPYDHRAMIEKFLKDTFRCYQQHQPLFTQQRLHNNTTLTNFLVDKKTVHMLDLSHVREDYTLSDLASLVISCLFLDIPFKTIEFTVEDYFKKHKMGIQYMPPLNTLIKLNLINEYLKNIVREKSLNSTIQTSAINKDYPFHLKAREKKIVTALRKMTNDSKFLL